MCAATALCMAATFTIVYFAQWFRLELHDKHPDCLSEDFNFISESNSTGLFENVNDSNGVIQANDLVDLDGNESMAVGISADDQIYCYCQDIGLTHLLADGGDYPQCDHFIWQSVQVTALTVCASCTVVLVNCLLRALLVKFSKFELPQNHTSLNSSIVTKTTLALFINTALILVLVNADFSQGFFTSVLTFNWEWYEHKKHSTRNYYCKCNNYVSIPFSGLRLGIGR